MSANGKFWANVEQCRSPVLYIHATHQEKDDLDKCCKIASANNVLTGIDYRVLKYVEELLISLIDRSKRSQKTFSDRFIRGR